METKIIVVTDCNGLKYEMECMNAMFMLFARETIAYILVERDGKIIDRRYAEGVILERYRYSFWRITL